MKILVLDTSALYQFSRQVCEKCVMHTSIVWGVVSKHGFERCDAFFVFLRGMDLLLCFVWVIRGPRVGIGQFLELVQLARTASSRVGNWSSLSSTNSGSGHDEGEDG
jgi:hypothetical protein